MTYINMERVKATLSMNKLALYQPSPNLLPYMLSDAPRILVRAANRIGKTMAAAAKLSRLLLTHPHRHYRAVGVNYQQSIGVVGKYLHDLIPADQLLPGCRYTQSIGWTHQLVELQNGSTCEIRTSEQAAISHAGSDLNGVWIDEFCPQEILLESITRVMSKRGFVWQTGTPVGRPVKYFKDLIEAPDSDWKEYVVPFSAASCPWYTGEQVDAWIEEQRAYPDTYGQKINGAWDSPTQERVYSGYDTSCLIEETDKPPKQVKLGIGIDHGEGAGRQVAVLIAWNRDGIWILDECISTTATSPQQDSRAIREMLLRNGYDVHLIHQWIGDTNSAGKMGAGYKINDILAQCISKEAGYLKQGIRIGSPMKGPGSVDYGEKLLNAGFLRHQVHVHPCCETLVHSLRHYRGTSRDEDLKHVLDAVRYIALDPLDQMNNSKTNSVRYQL